MPNKPEVITTPEINILAEILHFTADDLAANRAGKLSERQRSQFILKLAQDSSTPCALLMFFIFVLWISCFYRENIFSTILSFIFLIFAEYYVYSLWQGYRAQAIRDVYVAAVEETFTYRASFKRYYLHIHGKELWIHSEEYRILKQYFHRGYPCIVYYLPYTNELLSVEPLHRDKSYYFEEEI